MRCFGQGKPGGQGWASGGIPPGEGEGDAGVPRARAVALAGVPPLRPAHVITSDEELDASKTELH